VDLGRLDHASTLVHYQVARDAILLVESDPFERSRFVASEAAPSQRHLPKMSQYR
jgi:hypothetical protein